MPRVGIQVSRGILYPAQIKLQHGRIPKDLLVVAELTIEHAAFSIIVNPGQWKRLRFFANAR
jgi:hypothetical protein